MTEKNGNNGRITNQKVYDMHAAVMEKIGGCEVAIARVETKQEDMGEDIKALSDTVGGHTEKIGVIRGKLAVWGVVGGGGVSIVVFVIARLIFGG